MLLYGHVCHQLKGLDFHILEITLIPTFLKTVISFVFHCAMAYIFQVTLLTAKKRIIHFDSLRPNSAKNPTSEEIATILLGKVDVLYESYFTERKQFVLPHGNTTKDSFFKKPNVRTNKGALEKTKQMVRDGVKPKTIYDSINNNTGGVYFSTSQSNELRDSKHVYRQSQLVIAEKKCDNENYDKNDELIATTELQREKKDFI